MSNSCYADCSPVARIILEKSPSFRVTVVSFSGSFASKLSGWSNSSQCPEFMTRIRSASMTVASLCAMMSTVRLWKLSLSFCWIRLSVSKSTFAVASSRTSILVSSKMARARQRSYFWPTENKLLLSETTVSNLLANLSICSNSLTSLRTVHTSWSDFS